MSVHDSRGSDGDWGGNAASYVLGALPEAEYESFVLHLASCAVCREEVASLQAVVASLPAAVPQHEPPTELKKRVMSAVHEDARRAPASEAGVVRPGTVSAQWWRRPALAPLGLALASIVALAIVLLTSAGPGGGSRVIHAQVSAPGARATMLVSGSHAQLTLTNMPQSGPGRVYEVWIERTGPPSPTTTLFTVTSSGSAAVGIPGSITGVNEVLVTSEPLGGSHVPTRPPVITAKLT
jgi:anti-sigma-K factor RskA